MMVSSPPVRFGKLIYDREKAAKDLGAESARTLDLTVGYLLQTQNDWSNTQQKNIKNPAPLALVDQAGLHFQIGTGRVKDSEDELRRIDFQLLDASGKPVPGSQVATWARDLTMKTVRESLHKGLDAYKAAISANIDAIKHKVEYVYQITKPELLLNPELEVKTVAEAIKP